MSSRIALIALLCPLIAPGLSPGQARYPAELRRASAAWGLRNGPKRQVVDLVCLVPDIATYYEALSTWDRDHYFPILIDDVDLTLKFLHAFRPARVVRYPKRADPINADQVWDLATQAVGATWKVTGLAPVKPLRGDLRPDLGGLNPPGVVLGFAESPSLPGLAALAAGRFQPIVRLDSTKRYGDLLSANDMTTLLDRSEAAIKSVAPDYARLGDDCDFLTLAGDLPYRYQSPKGLLAVDDRLGRSGPSFERWAFTGRLMGDGRYSVYAAMCGLFLQPESALLFNGYPEDSPPWDGYTLRPAAEKLRRVVPTGLYAGDDRGTLKGWHEAFDPMNRHGLLFINTKGSPNQFDLIGGPAHALDVMPSVPTAVCIIHSYSAVDPTNPTTVAGRWLAQGAFVYHGSMDEPYLNAFRPPSLVAELMVEGIPFGAALRASSGEAFGQPWKLVYLGDPFYRLQARNSVSPRVRDFLPADSWTRYEEGRQPDSTIGDAERLAWALKIAIARQASHVVNANADDIFKILRSIDRNALALPARAVLDELTLVLLLRGQRLDERRIRAVLGSIPLVDRSPNVRRMASSALVAAFDQAIARSDLQHAGLVWGELMREEADAAFKSQITSRVASIVDTPPRRGEWRQRLRTLRPLVDKEGEAIIATELKRVDASSIPDRTRPVR